MNGRADAVTGWGYPSQRHQEPSSGIGPAPTPATHWWPYNSHLELAAFPSAIPSARSHARLVACEWGHGAIAATVELVVSELVTNGVKAAQSMEYGSTVRLELSGDETRVLVAVWDGNPEPVRALALGGNHLLDLEAEGGRGLFLVESLSTDCGVYQPEGLSGKVVWCLVAVPESDDLGAPSHFFGGAATRFSPTAAWVAAAPPCASVADRTLSWAAPGLLTGQA
jgi:anti-sigma regulatory factor (Ser/Thr protein kinase)